MDQLYSGLLWLTQPSATREAELEKAVEYTEGKYKRAVQLIACPVAEKYPARWRGIPVRPDKRILANHIFLVTAASDGAALGEQA